MSPTVSAPAFPERLASLRKQAPAERIGVHAVLLRRCEPGASQPTLDVIRKIATALQFRADLLLLGKGERGPEGMIPKHEASRWSGNRGGERK